MFGLPTDVVVILAIILVVMVAAVLYQILSDDSSPKDGDSGETPEGHDHSKGAENCAACQASSNPKNVKVPEKCLVLFRPDPAWKGEYGFDWLRENDTGLSGDVHYKNIVGSYGSVYATESAAVFTKSDAKYMSLRNGSYGPFNVSWKIDAAGKTYSYPTPALSLFPKDQCSGNSKKFEAKVKLKIEVVGKEPEMLRFDYNSEFLELDKKEVSPKSVGKHEMMLTIKSIKESDKDLEIAVYPYKDEKDSLSGKLIILKNDKANRYKAKVVFVKVASRINAVAKKGGTTGEKAFLERYLFQGLISIDLKEEDLNLVGDASFNTNWVINQDPATKAVNTYAADDTTIHSFLEGKLSALKPEYSNHFKVFFFDESGGYFSGGNYIGLNGGAKSIPSKSVVLYNSHNTSTTTHEILHAMGLQHTFDNNGQYTYKIGETENIMDYSHQPSYGSKSRITTWKWQWDKLHSVLGKE